MPRSLIVGSGAHIPPREVTNDMLARIMDTSDSWIRERSGVEKRYYVEAGTGSMELGASAARQALADASVEPSEVDLVVFATMTPDYYFPGNGALLQKELGLREIPCFDIRQQCVGFLYGLQLVDAHVRSGMAKTVLLVGSEVHTGFMPYSEASWKYLYGESDVAPTETEREWNSRFRHLTVLFGDAGAAVVVRAVDDETRGLLDHDLHTNGADFEKLYVPGMGFKRRPYADLGQFERGDHIPVMDGRYVFRLATTNMVESARRILERNGFTIDDVSMVLMHQANKRINEYCQQALGIPDSKVIDNIQRYGNTTAATIPLLWDEAARAGRIKPNDLVLMVAFGAGMSWGATLARA